MNLSRRHFKDPDALAKLQKIAEDNGVPTDLLELELTESIFFNDRGIEYVKKQIQEMHRIGFRCSLDDFGAGYSSLGLLMEFDVDVVKLDRRFFLDVGRKKARDVVTAITENRRKNSSGGNRNPGAAGFCKRGPLRYDSGIYLRKADAGLGI